MFTYTENKNCEVQKVLNSIAVMVTRGKERGDTEITQIILYLMT